MAESEGVFYNHYDELTQPLLDLIDSLRMVGIDKDLDLPAIAVIGDQSSGKSSVLEALSGVGLPRGSGIVTRCPLELRLRKLKPGEKWKAAIKYTDQAIDFYDPSQVEKYVMAAQDELAGEGVGISSTLIHLEIMSPDVCDLTLIDLPGITRVPVPGQPEDISDQIKTLILNFIEKKGTINLVVVPCNVDIATTEALRMAQEVDPEGRRTLAILTKPDLVDHGTERNVLAIALNQVIQLRKGYIMVKCRGQQQIHDRVSLAEATRLENEFFEHHKHFGFLMKEGKATTQVLSTALTQELVHHISNSLPILSEQVKSQLVDVKKELSQYKKSPPDDLENKKLFFTDLMTSFIDKIFGLVSGEVINDKTLYVLLRGQFENFKNGLETSKASFAQVVDKVIAEYDEVHRGRELPAFNNWRVFAKTVENLVIEQQLSALRTLNIIKDKIQEQLVEIVKSCFSNYPQLQQIIMKMIETIQSKQLDIVEGRVQEQFEMEKLVYTQDSIFYATVDDIEGSCADQDYRENYPKMLKGYYEIVVQRLADQIPMLIQFFLLQQSANLLRREALGLMTSANLDKCLCENEENSRRRKELQSRQDRLVLAYEKLSFFS